MESFPSYSATDNPTNSVVITIEPAGIGRTQTEDKIPLERIKTIVNLFVEFLKIGIPVRFLVGNIFNIPQRLNPFLHK